MGYGTGIAVGMAISNNNNNEDVIASLIVLGILLVVTFVLAWYLIKK